MIFSAARRYLPCFCSTPPDTRIHPGYGRASAIILVKWFFQISPHMVLFIHQWFVLRAGVLSLTVLGGVSNYGIVARG